jgi:phage replication-related protein YjqB (UPF0714/DUF867 family)
VFDVLMRASVSADDYSGYGDLTRDHAEGVDYVVHVRPPASSRVAIIAPHGGRIEGGTSEVARLIAGHDHGLYLFEGIRVTDDNFDRLHLTSRFFDEPRCLGLIAGCDTAIAVHGYASHGPDVLLGGLDERLKSELAPSLMAQGLSVQTHGHSFPGREPLNVCNRTRLGRGVQMELSAGFRRTRAWSGLVEAVRAVLGCSVADPRNPAASDD